MLINMPDKQEPPSPPEPKALRALAHPLRWKLIDLLDSEDTATATRCSEVLGESVASCSYHLGILGKYGYTEMVPDQPGREKPWRLSSRLQDLSPAGLDLPGQMAAEAAAEAFLDHEIARLKDRLRRISREPEEWRNASGVLGATTWMTPAELRTAREQIQKIMLRLADRADNPAQRPRGAREVRLFSAVTVAPPAPPAANSAWPATPAQPAKRGQ
jgi:hypothetical protein